MRFLALPALLLLLAPPGRADEPAVRVTKTGTTLDFYAGNDLATKYHYAGTAPDPMGGTKPLAKPYFWPVYAPGQIPVTRDWPLKPAQPGGTKDHVHQKSAWFCHGDVIPEGVELKVKSADRHIKGVDFWSETAGHGRIICTKVGEPKAVSPTHVLVPTANEWVAADGTKVLDETRTIHFLTLPVGRLVVLDIDLLASAAPITFGDTKEGAMGVRVNDAIRADPKAKTGGTLTNAAGKTGEKSVWGYAADWVDYFGKIDGKAAGVAVFDDPRNPFRAAWHARGYGLLAANPFGRSGSGFPSQKGKRDLVKLAKGDHLKLRYAIYAHDGNTTAGHVADAYRAFTAMK